jgi:hypothetical protein
MIMETASFTGLVKVLFWLIVSYYAIRFLFRLFAPMLVEQAVKKAQQTMYERQQQQYSAQHQPDPAPGERLREKKKVGEYIDYEEID